MNRFRPFLAGLLIAMMPAVALAQVPPTATISPPTVMNGWSGRSVATGFTFVLNADGSLATMGGSSGGGSSASVGTFGVTAPTSGDLVGYIGADGNLHGWVGDNAGHPMVGQSGTWTVGINQATQGTTNGVVVNSSALPAGAATAAKQASLDTNGDQRLQSVTLTPFYVALTANTSTTILAVSAARVGFDIQCASGGVAVSRTGATLTSATPSAGGADLVIPASANAYFTPAYASKTQAITGYTATAQACWGMSYAQQ